MGLVRVNTGARAAARRDRIHEQAAPPSVTPVSSPFAPTTTWLPDIATEMPKLSLYTGIAFLRVVMKMVVFGNRQVEHMRCAGIGHSADRGEGFSHDDSLLD